MIRGFTGGTRTAAAAAFSADGALVAIGGDDQLIGVWDVDSGELRDTLRGHAAPVHGLVFSADGRTLYSASRDNSVIAWDVAGDRSFASRRSRTPALPAPASDQRPDHSRRPIGELVRRSAPRAHHLRRRQRGGVDRGRLGSVGQFSSARRDRTWRARRSPISIDRRYSAPPRRARWCATTCAPAR